MEPRDITLNVTAASVRVETDISISSPNELAASSALSDLEAYASNSTSLSQALNVQVEAIEAAPTLSDQRLVPAPSPPHAPPLPPTSPPPPDDPPPPDADETAGQDDLRRKIDELQKQLAELSAQVASS